MILVRLTAALLLAIALSHGRQALAHAEHGTGEPVPQLASSSKLPKGVDLLVIKTTAYQFSLSSDGEQDIEVLADNGEPFIRIRQRIIQVNLNSAHWYRAQQPGGGAVPARLKLGDEVIAMKPDWKPVAQQTGFGWYDPRLVDENLTSFKLALNINGTRHVVEIQRKPLAAFKGFWTSRLTRASQSVGLDAMIPGLSTGTIALTRAADSKQTFEVLDAQGKPFIRSAPDGYSVDVKHPWFKSLGLYVNVPDLDPAADGTTAGKAAAANPLWVAASPSLMLTYQDPRLKAPNDNSKATRSWRIPVRGTSDGKTAQFAGDIQWRSTR